MKIIIFATVPLGHLQKTCKQQMHVFFSHGKNETQSVVRSLVLAQEALADLAGAVTQFKRTHVPICDQRIPPIVVSFYLPKVRLLNHL